MHLTPYNLCILVYVHNIHVHLIQSCIHTKAAIQVCVIGQTLTASADLLQS